MPQQRARRVGWLNEPDGASGLIPPRAVYQALIGLECAGCHRAIAPGERFTRRRRFAEAATPVCRACGPFTAPG